ncbi:MAG TPA: F0F1 ATP synthase subunit B [Acidimicrobiia bacterium]|jgi:F-type H+-transporting ATPase subunit b
MLGWALVLAEEASDKGGSFTDLKLSTAVWAWIAFLTTFFILSKVAWPGLAAKMEARELRIAEGLQKAEEAEQRARDIAAQQEQLLAEARQESQKLIAEARAASENVKQDLLRQAQEEIGAERERAKTEISLERARAVDEIKQVAVDLTLEASARLLRRELRDEDHQRLAREVVEEVASRL